MDHLRERERRVMQTPVLDAENEFCVRVRSVVPKLRGIEEE
jgi:hypothetical protein